MFEQYVEGVKASRVALTESRFANEFFADNANEDQIERFWMHFCALGTRITAPVEQWIRRAGLKCESLGFGELGKALLGHAKAEAGHDQMMHNDVQTLSAFRKAAGRSQIDVKSLFETPNTLAMNQYIQLHEEIVDSSVAFAQLAIEYEIEGMSKNFGPKLVAQSELRVPGITQCLSFVNEHIELDQGHTEFNERQLKRFLAAHGEVAKIKSLISAGVKANNIYSAFFDECWNLAK